MPAAGAVTEGHLLHRYEAGKCSIREALNPITDTERVVTFRAWWFARGPEGPSPASTKDMIDDTHYHRRCICHQGRRRRLRRAGEIDHLCSLKVATTRNSTWNGDTPLSTAHHPRL
ncbi:MAG: hypothetical protein JNK87_36905 [Bryobacterales bacterium]|nr:hypothetical protein [Bryobacterales bacterium]